MKKTLLFSCLFCIAVLSTSNSNAQSAREDSIIYSNALADARMQFTKNIGINAYLYNGTAYARYWNGIVGFPFFEKEDFQQGDLDYTGALYNGISLKYDLFRDELVTKTFANDAEIKLITDKIAAFSIGSHHFVKILRDSLHTGTIKTGYYESLYRGRLLVYVHHEKKAEKSLQVGENFTKFVQYDQYYIEKGGLFHLIEGESDLQNVLKDQKAEIRKLLNRGDIHYKKDPAATIVQVAAFYDRLKK